MSVAARPPVAKAASGSSAATASGRCAAPETSQGVPIASQSAVTAVSSSSPATTRVAAVSGRGSTLKVDLGDDGERAPRAGEALGEVVAGDVLHHAPARLERLAAAGDGLDAEHMVARRARLDAARAAGVRRQHAADRAAPARPRRRAGRNPSARRRASGCDRRAAARSRQAACPPWRRAPAPPARRA